MALETKKILSEPNVGLNLKQIDQDKKEQPVRIKAPQPVAAEPVSTGVDVSRDINTSALNIEEIEEKRLEFEDSMIQAGFSKDIAIPTEPDAETKKNVSSIADGYRRLIGLADKVDAKQFTDLKNKLDEINVGIQAKPVNDVVEVFRSDPEKRKEVIDANNVIFSKLAGELKVETQEPFTGRAFSKGLKKVTQYGRNLSDNSKSRLFDTVMKQFAPLSPLILPAIGNMDAKSKVNMVDATLDSWDFTRGAVKGLENMATIENAAIMTAMGLASPQIALGATMYFTYGSAMYAVDQIEECMQYSAAGDGEGLRVCLGELFTTAGVSAALGTHSVKGIKGTISSLKQKGVKQLAKDNYTEMSQKISQFGEVVSKNTGAMFSGSGTIKDYKGELVNPNTKIQYVGDIPTIIVDPKRKPASTTTVTENINHATSKMFEYINKDAPDGYTYLDGIVRNWSQIDQHNPITKKGKIYKYNKFTGEKLKSEVFTKNPEVVHDVIDISNWGSMNKNFKDAFKDSYNLTRHADGGYGMAVEYHATIQGLKIENFKLGTAGDQYGNRPSVFTSKNKADIIKFVQGAMSVDKYKFGKNTKHLYEGNVKPPENVQVYALMSATKNPFEYFNKSHRNKVIEMARENGKLETILSELKTSEAQLKNSLKQGNWGTIERLLWEMEQLGFDGALTSEFGGSTAHFYPQNLYSISNTNPKVRDIVELQGMIGGLNPLPLFKKAWRRAWKKNVIEADFNHLQNMKAEAFNEYLLSLPEGSKPSKKTFSKYIQETFKLNEEGTPQATKNKAKEVINSFSDLKSAHNKAVKGLSKLETGEGGMPLAPVGKAAEKYAGNFKLETFPESQQPFIANVVRHIGETELKQIRKGRGWDETAAESVKPANIEAALKKIFDSEEIIKRDGAVNKDLRVNDMDVYTYKIISGALVEAYKFNPTPENLVRLEQGLKASSAVISTSGRTLSANKMVIESANTGVKAIDNMLEAIGNKAKNPNWLDKVVEWSRNMKLMSPSSVVRSTIGNTSHWIMNVLDMQVSALNNKIISTLAKGVRKDLNEGGTPVVRDRQTRFHSESISFLEGTSHGLKSGVKKAGGMMLENPEIVNKYSMYGRESFNFDFAIGGAWGKLVRTPQRAQGAIDILIREPSMKGFIYRFADRKAQSEGYKWGTPEWKSRKKEIIEKPTSEIITEAQKSAEYITFQSELGRFAKQVNMLRSGDWGQAGQIFIPFYNTPVNLFKSAIHRSPLGIFSADVIGGMKQGMKTGDWGRMSDGIARAQVGTAITAVMAQALIHSMDGEIEGSWKGLKKDERDFRLAQGRLPNSIRYYNEKDGKYITRSFEGYEPAASLLRFLGGYEQGKEELALQESEIANYVKIRVPDLLKEGFSESEARNKAWDEAYNSGAKSPYNIIGTEIGKSLVLDFADNPFLSGVGDIITMLDRWDENGAMAIYASNFGRSVALPNFVSQLRPVMDEIKRDRPEGLNILKSQFPILREDVTPKLGLFGETLLEPDPKGGMVGMRKIETANNDRQFMYEEFDRLGMGKMKSYANKEFSNYVELNQKQRFLLKHIGGTMLEKLLSPIMLSSTWSKFPNYVQEQAINNTVDAVKTFIDREVLEEEVFSKMMDAKTEINTMMNIGGKEFSESQKREYRQAIFKLLAQENISSELSEEKADSLKAQLELEVKDANKLDDR